MHYILVGPSGSGKTTIASKIAEEFDDIRLTVQWTTRTPRPQEVNGKDYTFATDDEFLQMKMKDAFAATSYFEMTTGPVFYGIKHEDVSVSSVPTISVLDPVMASALLRQGYTVKVIWLDVPSTDLMDDIDRRGDAHDEAIRRLTQDLVQFKHMEDDGLWEYRIAPAEGMDPIKRHEFLYKTVKDIIEGTEEYICLLKNANQTHLVSPEELA